MSTACSSLLLLPVAHKALVAWMWLECSLFEHYSGLDGLSLLILC